MTTDRIPVSQPRWWLLIGAVLAAVSIALLWPLQYAGQICALSFPAPPGCGAPEPRIATLTAIVVIVATFVAMVIITFTAKRPRLPLIILTGTILVIALLAAAIVALSQTGIWDAPFLVN